MRTDKGKEIVLAGAKDEPDTNIIWQDLLHHWKSLTQTILAREAICKWLDTTRADPQQGIPISNITC